MYSYKSFLKLGEYTGVNLTSLISEGYELTDCSYLFQQGIDDNGKAVENVFGGSISLTLPMLPTKEIISWGLNSRIYKKGAIILLDAQDLPMERLIFENGACISLDIDYSLNNQYYIYTKIEIRAEVLTLGNGIFFDNNWVY